jgi:UDP-N-acetylmuramate-alanine ligase
VRPAILSFAEVLGLLSKDRTPVVMAGSFGKTTSVSLLSHCLLEAGLDPSFMIGAAPLSPPKAWHVGQGELLPARRATNIPPPTPTTARNSSITLRRISS